MKQTPSNAIKSHPNSKQNWLIFVEGIKNKQYFLEVGYENQSSTYTESKLIDFVGGIWIDFFGSTKITVLDRSTSCPG